MDGLNVKKLIVTGLTSGFLFCLAEVGLAKATKITAEELCRRFEIQEEILVFDKEGLLTNFLSNVRGGSGISRSKSGKKDLSKEDVLCQFSNMSGQSAEGFEVFYSHEWEIKKNGSVQAKYNQGTGISGRGKESKLLNPTGEVAIEASNLQSVTWASPYHKDQKITFRLTPRLRDTKKTAEISKFPIVLSNSVIFDGKGRLWAASVGASGEYICFSGTQGTISLSFNQFKGATKTARVEGNTIKFKGPEDLSIVIKSDDFILPAGMFADAFVKVDLVRRSENINSSHVSSGDEASTIDKCVN
jgi:hypothetical protein